LTVATEAEAIVTFHITTAGIAVRLANRVPVKGLQFSFGEFSSVPASMESQTFFGEGYHNLVQGELRFLMYDAAGAILEPGERIVANLPLGIDDPKMVKVKDILLGGKDNQRLLVVESQVTFETAPELPVEFSLSQNFPNPFNPSTDIQFTVPQAGQVRITVYNTLGQEVRTLFEGQADRGTRIVRWDEKDSAGRGLSSGTYLYRMVSGSFTETKKMLLLK
jgi:hypothetical protein